MDTDNGNDAAPANGAPNSAQPPGDAAPPANGTPPGGGTPPGSAAPTVSGGMNLVDAVQQTRSIMRVDAGDTSKVLDAGIGYQKASQAAAFAVQDATDFLRNVMTMAATAEGVALKLMIEYKDAATYTPILAAAQQAVAAAAQNLQTVGTAATSVATGFPR